MTSARATADDDPSFRNDQPNVIATDYKQVCKDIS